MCAGKRGATITSIFSDSPSSFSRYEKSLDFCKVSPGEETEEGVCFERGAKSC